MSDFPSYGYLVILVISLFGVWTLDKKFKLAFFKDSKAATASILSLVIFLLIADIAGIAIKIFFTNEHHTTGLNILTPNLPIEEVLLLILIGYSCLAVFNRVDNND